MAAVDEFEVAIRRLEKRRRDPDYIGDFAAKMTALDKLRGEENADG